MIHFHDYDIKAWYTYLLKYGNWKLCIWKRYTYGVAPSFLHAKMVRQIVDHLGCVVLIFSSIAIELNVPRVEIFILISTKNMTLTRMCAFQDWGWKINMKKKQQQKTTTYDPGGTRTQDPPFWRPTDYSLSHQFRWAQPGDLDVFDTHIDLFTPLITSKNIPRFPFMFVCLCWGLTSQSTIFQSCWDEAIASWVINQYFRGVKCLAQGHTTAAVGFEPPTLAPEFDTVPLSHRAPLRLCKES